MRRRGMPLYAPPWRPQLSSRGPPAPSAIIKTRSTRSQNAAAQQQQDMAYQQGVADAQAQQQQVAPPPQQYAPAPAAPPPPAAAPDLTAQLQQLAQLHTAGVLSDEEFAAAKQKLLAG